MNVRLHLCPGGERGRAGAVVVGIQSAESEPGAEDVDNLQFLRAQFGPGFDRDVGTDLTLAIDTNCVRFGKVVVPKIAIADIVETVAGTHCVVVSVWNSVDRDWAGVLRRLIL